MPSTIANILDLLKNSKETIGINDNITWPYIVYQFVLMFGTIIGPGTIFLMLVGASVVVFGISNYQAFFWNLVPIFFYVLTCMKAKPKWQLGLSRGLSTCYALLMIAAAVGTGNLWVNSSAFFQFYSITVCVRRIRNFPVIRYY